VLGIILRGVCLMRPQEINWMFGGGAGGLGSRTRGCGYGFSTCSKVPLELLWVFTAAFAGVVMHAQLANANVDNHVGGAHQQRAWLSEVAFVWVLLL
jgi:hypothetical protein